MESRWPGAAQWLAACSVEQDVYHGGTFNGNNSRKLLRNIDILRGMCPLDCLQYVTILDTFNNVVESCFGNELKSDFETRINNFKYECEASGIRLTPKMHCIFHHVPYFCKQYACGLGAHSEQASESVHALFKISWGKYKVPKSHPGYAKSLLKAVKEFNCYHV